jgi:hypothetical protein
MQIQPHDVAHLFDELRIRGELEILDPMRLQAEGLPDATHRGMTDPAPTGQRSGAPVRGVGGQALQGHRQDAFDLVVADRPRRAGAGLVQQARQATLDKAAPPLPRRVGVDPHLGGDPAIGLTSAQRKTMLTRWASPWLDVRRLVQRRSWARASDGITN